jgi:two-component system invasion response regulator UvrY
MLEILVVDNHAIYRAGLRQLLSEMSDMRVAGEASDSASAVMCLRHHRYGAVVISANLTGDSGLDALAVIRAERPELPVVMLSVRDVEQDPVPALHGRAIVYLSKNVAPEELVHTIREIGCSRPGRSPDKAAPVSPEGSRYLGLRSAHARLTPREAQVAMKIVQGLSLTEIGSAMGLSVKTASTYRTRALGKLGFSNNAQLVKHAMRIGLVN